MKILLRDNYKIQPDELCCKDLDEATAKILVKFLEQYDGREKNISRDNDSLQLSEMI